VTEKTQSSQRSSTRRPRRSSGGDRRFTRRRRTCYFCAEKVNSLDYKQVDLLKRYIKEDGRIRPRRETGACAKHQRMVATAVKRARHMAILPFAADNWR